MNFRTFCNGFLLLLAMALYGCDANYKPSAEPVSTETTAGTVSSSDGAASQEPENPELTKAYFGDLHVHTKYSFDAFMFGTRATPRDAYRYARGEALTHPAGFKMQLSRPLDFLAVTDHAVYLGIVPEMANPLSTVGKSPIAKQVREARTAAERGAAFLDFVTLLRIGEGDGLLDMDIVRSAWNDTVSAAEELNRPGEFTTFSAYEFSSAPDSQNLHRNVIFRGSNVPEQPFSLLDSRNPEDLWSWMDGLRERGIESLAIPHNSNASNGQMFKLTDWAGDPLSDEYAIKRMRNEPLAEITQVKGTSETLPAQSPDDEWAGFEIFPYRVGSSLISEPSGGYVRQALKNGLAFADKGSVNPFRYGVIGASDTHVGAGSFDESDYWSKVGLTDSTAELRGSVPTGLSEKGEPQYAYTYFQTWGASGLAGVWAKENTRAALYDALRRREVFATSGPRIRLRFFSGQNFPTDLLQNADVIDTAYSQGVPMGGEVLVDETSATPHMLAWAVQDPESAPLQRLQIVKGWVSNGQTYERVYDVACSDGLEVDPITHRCPDNGARVELGDCSITSGLGATELKVLWQDPAFDAAEHAFYYVRALENPTCRWSTWDALRAGVAPRGDLPATLQERAWSSPIWHLPVDST